MYVGDFEAVLDRDVDDAPFTWGAKANAPPIDVAAITAVITPAENFMVYYTFIISFIVVL